uniref:Uncharacterized protein n=1 Tax=Schlesneria paludicola TaxID=360056 RepID=A0A7C2NVS2_9PLAN
MNRDEAWQDWLARRRDGPRTGMADRIMSAWQKEGTDAAVAQPAPSSRRGVFGRLIPYVLWCAAALVCVVRVYSVVSLLVSPVVMQSEEAEPQELANEQLVVSRT